jgi:exodeoxyribonuclease V beta subunit
VIGVEPSPLDLTGPLFERSRLVIEASAGTGKTFTLAALVARYVAEADVAVDQILVVTFTRAAAAELRERIRRRLVQAAAHLADPDPSETDPLLVHLAAGDAERRDRRRRRLDQAVIDYDTATITTIHGFCQQVLATLGSAGRHNADAVLVHDTSELVVGVSSDALVAAALGGDTELPTLDALAKLVRTVLNNPGIEVVAASGEPSDERLADLVDRATDEIHRRLAGAGSTTYDGLLTDVRDAVRADPALARRLAERFPVALVDEFQDTDPVQWEILSTVFGAPPSTLVIVGDPKQAIYSFRGGDVHTYLRAADDPAAVTRTLDTNWRSDRAVVEAMNGLCAGLELGDAGIAFHRVHHAPGQAGRALVGADGSPLAPISVRLATDPAIPRVKGGKVGVGSARELIELDLAAQVAELLADARVVGDASRPDRRLGAGDVAVLIQAHSEGAPIQRALARWGIPSVITGGRSVTESAAADQWRVLLAALSRPSDPGRARAAALGWFWGWTAEELAEASDDRLADIQFRHDQWAAVLRLEGVAALVSRIRHESGLVSQVLARPDGERDLTDLEHLAELLHQSSDGRPVGAAQLVELLADLDRDQGEDDDPEAIKRRVDSDEAAVQIMTVHAAKGLEFGVVCCPSLWNPSRLNVTTKLFHDPDLDRRVLDVSQGKSKAVERNRRLTRVDQMSEHVRLAYVALTRARHRSLVWWAGPASSGRTGLARVLFGADPEADDPAAPATVLDDADCLAGLRRRFAERGAGSIELVEISASPGVGAPRSSVIDEEGAAELARSLTVAEIGHPIDRSAGRWSFTAMARVAALDPDDETLGDHGSADQGPGDLDRADLDPDDVIRADLDPDDVTTPPLAEVGAGAAFGTLVHAVLEDVDFAAPRLDDQIAEAIDRRAWLSDAIPDVERLTVGLRAAIDSPMGAAFDRRSLRSFPRADRLDELEFELPLGAGIDHQVATRSIGRLVEARLHPSDPIRPWATRLADGLIDLDVGGFLTGSIDLVMRLTGPDGPRFCVADYKTNRVSPPGAPVALADFHPDRLPAAMIHHHYPLQALLYAVALHRFLRWRVAGYDPDRHLGPIGYLFLRGMVGPDTPAPDGRAYGVFAWTLPPGLVDDLSRVLAGEEVVP